MTAAKPTQHFSHKSSYVRGSRSHLVDLTRFATEAQHYDTGSQESQLFMCDDLSWFNHM